MSHVKYNSGNNEWYTPLHILERVTNTLGVIDLDVASCPVAQQNVKALNYYTEQDDALTKEWYGNVWMNPPYSSALIKQFCSKLNKEYTNGNINSFICLTNNATETTWFKELYVCSKVFCFTSKRVKFLDSDGNPKNQPLQGQVLCANGDEATLSRFVQHFSDTGLILFK